MLVLGLDLQITKIRFRTRRFRTVVGSDLHINFAAHRSYLHRREDVILWGCVGKLVA